jgi:4-hydroxy-4-methyl-2-oxoglutarate aldolase
MKIVKGERQELLKLYHGLRVADVRDGMDWLMMHRYGSMSPDIRPLWRTWTFGIARTVRYVPYAENIPTMSPAEYSAWSARYYREICPYPWIQDIEDGDFIVIDQSGIDAGLMGSNNSLEGVKHGARGYVTNGGVRDTDELILEKVPFWSRFISQSMVQGRLRYDAKDVSVIVGGVTICPGDIIVADGDGVIAVPRKIAHDVAKHARRELDNDKKGRRKLYQALGMETDNSIT